MKIYYNLNPKRKFNKGGVVSVGYFETLHSGHKKIIDEVIECSRENNLNNFILTFATHPKKERNEKSIFSINDRISFFRNAGIKNLIIIENTHELFNLTALEFLKYMKGVFNISYFVTSKDFKFGKDREGDGALITNSGFKLVNVEPFLVDGQPLSTTTIKKIIRNGGVTEACILLNKPFFVTGIVKKGKQLGRKIGFPTMNIKVLDTILPANGTYITKTIIKSDEFYSMTYVQDTLVETHLIDYNYFHYNFKIKIDFFEKIRDNIDCINLLELSDILQSDLNKVKKYFNI